MYPEKKNGEGQPEELEHKLGRLKLGFQALQKMLDDFKNYVESCKRQANIHDRDNQADIELAADEIAQLEIDLLQAFGDIEKVWDEISLNDIEDAKTLAPFADSLAYENSKLSREIQFLDTLIDITKNEDLGSPGLEKDISLIEQRLEQLKKKQMFLLNFEVSLLRRIRELTREIDDDADE